MTLPAKMTSGFLAPLLTIWLIAVIGFGIGHRAEIAAGDFRGPDDDLRLVQVRDLLAGQDWFDTDQHRMNVPETAPMHWSRFVDLPIAAVILVTEPVFGRAGAERAAGVAVPALTLLVSMGALFALTRHLCGERLSAFAPIAAVIWPAVYIQMLPMRIDHHGWQVALAALTLLAFMDKRPWRSGLLAGLAAAAWVQISIEALPYLVAAAGFLAVLTIFHKGEARRLSGFLTALAGASLLLFLSTKAPGAWGEAWCDAVMPGHIAAFGLAALGTAPLALAPRLSKAQRLVTLSMAGLASAAGFAAIAPQCLASPFSTLDPLVHDLWYVHVLEGRPVWVQTRPIALVPLLPLALGALGTALGLRAAREGEAARRWLLAAFMLLIAIVIAIFVRRAIAVAAVYAVPGLTFLVRDLLARAESMEAALPRRPATMAGSLLALLGAATSPILPGLAFKAGEDMLSAKESEAEAAEAAEALGRVCMSGPALKGLAALRPSSFLSPIDIAPAILAHTPHRLVASGHHRNEAAMKAVMEAFLGDAQNARALIETRGLDGVLFCNGVPETELYAARAPEGFYAQLARGEIPDWLEPLPRDPAHPHMRVFLLADRAAVEIAP